jgi:hypothetical protein
MSHFYMNFFTKFKFLLLSATSSSTFLFSTACRGQRERSEVRQENKANMIVLYINADIADTEE